MFVGQPRKRFRRKKVARKAARVHRTLKAALIETPPAHYLCVFASKQKVNRNNSA
jgi:hypothetical protein